MSYQQQTGYTPVVGGVPPATAYRPASYVQSPVFPQVPPTINNPFALKASATKKLGIAILVLGIICFIYGITMVVVSPFYWATGIGGGIWSGIFVIVSGSLAIAAGSKPDQNCLRTGAIVTAILSLCTSSSCGLLNLVAFFVGVGCTNDCYYDYYNNYTCNSICDNGGVYITTIFLALLLAAVFVLTLIALIYLCRGCCSTQYSSQGYVVQSQPILGQNFGPSNNYQATGNAYGTVPQTSLYNQQPYAPPSEYSQAPMQSHAGSSGVTYGSDGSDYNQQQQIGAVPPPYEADYQTK